MAQLELPDAMNRLQANEERMDTFVNGNEDSAYTTTAGESVPSIQNFLKDQEAKVDALSAGFAADNGTTLVEGTWFGGLKAKVSALASSIGASLIGYGNRSLSSKLFEIVSVKDSPYNASGDSSTNDLAAFTAAYNDVVAGGTICIPDGFYAGVNGALTGTKFVIWKASGQPAGGGAWNLPGLVEQGFTTRKIFLRQQTMPDDDGKVSFTRVANHTGGTPGFVNANISVNTTVGANNTNFEWGFLTVLNNNAASGENCALYAQGNKLGVGPTWAGVFEAADKTNTANPTFGLLGLEVDVFANGTDTNNNRIGIDLVAGQYNRGGANVACEAFAAIRVNRRNNTGDVGDFNYGMVVNSAKVAAIALRQTGRMGIDTSEATFNDGTVPNMAMRMASGQRINFSATLTRTMRYEPSTSALRYATGSAVLWEAGDDGSFSPTGNLKLTTVGAGVYIKEGTNARQGVATLNAGSVTVPNTAVTANSRIQLTSQDNNTTGACRVSARAPGTSFTITSSNAADSGVVAYQIFEPA